MTCYASVDYPAPQFKRPGSSQPTSVSEALQFSVNVCVDATASFFNTYFEEGRPVDYDIEYRQNWMPVDIDKTTRIHLRINRDNPDLEAEADAILEQAEEKKKENLH